MSTTPQVPASATRLANEVIEEHGVTPDRLEVFFTGQDQELLEILAKLLGPMTDAELGIIGGMGPGRDDKQPGKTLADAGVGELLNKFGSGHQILVNLAATALALHMYNLLTGVTEGLTPGNAKSREVDQQVAAAFGSGDDEALQRILTQFGDGAAVRRAIERLVAQRRRQGPRGRHDAGDPGEAARLAAQT